MPPTQGPGSPLKSIPNKDTLRYVMVDAQADESPTRQEGWAKWFQTTKEQARPPINFWADPPLQQGNIFRLQAILKPIRFEFAQLERQGLYTEKLFDGWTPSHIFYNTAENRGNPNTRDRSLAISVVQFSPL